MSDYDSGSDDELELLRKNTSRSQSDIGSLDFPSAFDLNNIDLNLLDANSPVGSGLFDAAGNINLENIGALATDPELFAAFKEFDPASAALVADVLGGDYGFAPVGADNPVDAYERGSGEFLGENIKSGVPEWDKAATDAGLKLTDPNAKTGLAKILDDIKKGVKDFTGVDANDLAKYGLLAGIAKLAYDDAEKARKAKLGYIAPGGSAKRAVISPGGSVSYTKAASGGIMSLAGGGSVDEYGRTAQDKQKENLYRQLDAIDAWNTTQATNAGRELLPEERTMAVGVKDDFTGSGPGVVLYDPAKGQSGIVNSGSLSLLFERGDPAAAYEQAKNSLPYYQQKALLGIQGLTTQAQERRIVDALEKNPLPALTFMEYGLGQFAPPNYGLDPNIARRREENEQREIKEKPLEYFKDFLNLSPYQGGLPTIYQFPELTGYAEGGMTDKQPFYLGGPTDGMADEVPAHIDNKRPAALSDGEFVIPADVVSHLGNGNSNAGAKRLYEMMDNIRQARTGNKDQGVQINPNKFMLG